MQRDRALSYLFGAVVAVAVALASSLSGPSAHAEQDGQATDVQRVTGGSLVALEGGASRRALVISAEVPTAGWTDPQLVRAQYVTFPLDGIWDVVAVAVPPEGPSAQVISHLIMALDVTDDTAEVKGYRILSAENCVVVLADPEHVTPSDSCAVLGR